MKISIDPKLDLFHLNTFGLNEFTLDENPSRVPGLPVEAHRLLVKKQPRPERGPVELSILSRRDKIVGLLAEIGEDRHFVNMAKPFPDREAMAVYRDFTDALGKEITALAKNRETMRIENGVLTAELEPGNRTAIRALGEQTPEQRSPSRVFRVNADWKDRVIRTAASSDDSHGKAVWRAQLGEFALDHFGGEERIRKFGDTTGWVLCFPGYGKEAWMWQELGFQEKRMIFLENDKGFAPDLQRRFPEAHVLTLDYTQKRIIKKVNEILGVGRGLSVLSIDPYGQYNKSTRNALNRILNLVRLAPTSVVAHNYCGGRENHHTRKFLQSQYGLEEALPLEQLRKEVIEQAVNLELANPDESIGVQWNVNSGRIVTRTFSGSYEGNRQTKMFYTFNAIGRGLNS